MASFAFFTLNAYDMLTGGHEGDAVGGAQLQQILIGRELSNRGHEMYFVEYDSPVKEPREIEGIQIVTKPRPTGPEPMRALQAAQGTVKILRDIDPDICYRRGVDFEILVLSAYCYFSEARFIYGVAHDQELTEETSAFANGVKSTWPYKRLHRLALSNADGVITQNQYQEELAAQRLDTDIFRIPNCYEVNPVKPIDWEFDRPVVFWAARITPDKQPEIVAELAAQLPEVAFVMAGGPGKEELFESIRERAKLLDNLHVLGHIPFADIDRYFAAADLFLNTSEAEGFPNTFLQAWAQGTPVASLNVDPDKLLTNQEIGFVANGSTLRLRRKISELVDDENRLKDLGRDSRQYLKENHTVEKIADKYEQVFQKCK